MAEFDVIVVGGGLSGTQAALRVAELGGKVCLIEKEKVMAEATERAKKAQSVIKQKEQE